MDLITDPEQSLVPRSHTESMWVNLPSNLEPTSHCWWLAWFVFMWEDVCALYTPESVGYIVISCLPVWTPHFTLSRLVPVSRISLVLPCLMCFLSSFLIFQMLRILRSFQTQCRFCLFQRICWFLISQKQGLYSVLIWNISCEPCLHYLLYLISGSLWNCVSLNFVSCITPYT